MSVWGTGLVKGLVITIKNMFRGPITVQYPHEKIELPERARWTVAATLDEDGEIKCTACLSCVRACPDHVLDMQLTVGEDKTKHIDHLRYESAACMMCGLCVEACPFGAIHQTHDYELASTDFGTLTYDIIKSTDAAKPKRKAPAEGAAKPAAKPAAEAEPAVEGAQSDAQAPSESAPSDSAPAAADDAKEAQDA